MRSCSDAGSRSPSPSPAWPGCGTQQQSQTPTTQGQTQSVPQAHPQAVEPVAGAAAPAAAGGDGAGVVSVASPSPGLARPVSDSEISKELAASGISANPDQATLTRDGLAIAPAGAPPAVQGMITAGNEIARLPYRYGGGHLTYQDTAYDCSGSISFVFAASHLLNGTVVSGQLMNWGKAGPGKFRGPPPAGTLGSGGGGLGAELQHELREALRRLDLRAVADSGQQLEPRARDDAQDPLGAAVEHEPVAVAPHQQHR